MKYHLVAIEREYASGGSEIGEKLAEKLNIPCYGQEILFKAAEKMNLSPNELIAMEENLSGSLLNFLRILADVSSGKQADLSSDQKLMLVENNVIRDLAVEPCVIVGRSAAGLFKNQQRILKVFIHADDEMRVKRAVEYYGIDPHNALSVIRQYDKRRQNYFKFATGSDWRNSDVYHMVLNSAQLGIDKIVDILYTACV